MKLVFLPEVFDDIDRLYSFLKDKNPRSAQKAMLAIDEGIEMLLSNPFMGLQMEKRPEYQQLFVPFGRDCYVLRYRVDEANNALVVVRIWHGREDRDDAK